MSKTKLVEDSSRINLRMIYHDKSQNQEGWNFLSADMCLLSFDLKELSDLAVTTDSGRVPVVNYSLCETQMSEMKPVMLC